MIQQIIHFIKLSRNTHLVNLEKVMENEQEITLFYEYVPFRLEPWLLDINEELVGDLEEQLVELAERLCRASIRFRFDPREVGLNEKMEVKYFLN